MAAHPSADLKEAIIALVEAPLPRTLALQDVVMESKWELKAAMMGMQLTVMAAADYAKSKMVLLV